jgi:hypothetical protein
LGERRFRESGKAILRKRERMGESYIEKKRENGGKLY